MAKKTGDAAPEKPALIEEDVSDDILNAAASRLGVKLDLKTEPSAGEAEAGTETPEAKTAREAEEAAAAEAGAAETAEEKTAREAEEAAAAAETPEEKQAREAAGEETAEEKTAREAEEAAAADTPEAKAAAEHAAETKKLVALRLKDLPEALRQRVQGVIDARLGHISVQAKAEQARLEARVEELTDELEGAKKGVAPANVPGVHPLFLVAAESELEDRLTAIEQFEDFADRNPDGYDGDTAKGYPPWTAEQIKERLRELHRERDRVIPAVRKNLQLRAASDTELKKSYPALFDRKSEDYRSAQALLKLMPELRRHADMNVRIAQMILGAKALADLAQAKLPAAGSKTAATEPRKAPRVPGAGSSGRGSPVSTPAGGGKPGATAAMTTLMQQRPGDRAAFNDAVAAVVGELETL